ncbi:MAG: hypothetical protein Q7R88_03010 [bacterium]|nr:hypothetical protein [bacterium]
MMMPLSKDKRFLYSRFVLLGALIGAIGFAFAGFKGFPAWYGGFVFCFWVAFGLINIKQKSTLWLAVQRPVIFALFYIALTGASILADQFGVNNHLWFYPNYAGMKIVWVYLVLYPFGALSLLEFFYFLSGFFGEKLSFKKGPDTLWHGFFDISEHLLFLLMTGMIVAGALGFGVSIGIATTVAVLWFAFALVKLRIHVRHSGHYLLILVLTVVLALLVHQLPNTVAREWVYLQAPFLNMALLGLPIWVWVGWCWLLLVPLRLWIVLVLHPRIK